LLKLPTYWSVQFSAKDYGTINTKFELLFHQQSQQPGMLVDIRSLVSDYFLTENSQQNRIEANSRTAPAHKFLIIPVGEGQ
jgi:hypothetical protein